MSRVILRCALLLSLLVPVALGGVVIGGNVGGSSLRPTHKMSLKLLGSVKVIRWTGHTGRSVAVPHLGPVGAQIHLTPPRGTWVELELVFQGPVSVTDDLGHAVVVELDSLVLPLERPIAGGVPVTLELDILAPDGIWSAGPVIGRDSAMLRALVDGALARRSSTEE